MQEAVVRGTRTGAAVDLCRLALKSGVLIKDGRHWRYGRRLFNNATVNRLIEERVAVRVGDVVRSSGICSNPGTTAGAGESSPT